jgi:acyl-CoA thioester hydrolase
MELPKRQGGEMMEKDLAAYPVVVEIPVAWGEMDAFGHLNHAVYFRYMETARIAYFERLAIPEFLRRDPLGPILGSISCRYRAPLTYPDRVSVGAKVTRVEADRFVMAYVIFSHSLGLLAAEGEGTLVCFDYRQNRKAPLPEKLKSRIDALEATGS